MSILQYRQNKTRYLLMVMVIVFHIKDVSGISGKPGRKRFSRHPLRRHYNNVHDVYEWEPLAELKLIDRHDPSGLFEQLNKETIVHKNVLPDLFGELDNNWDYIKALKFNNKIKAITAGQLQANRERVRENDVLNDLRERLLRAKTEKELQMHRERLENAASDREFERMLNRQGEKSRGGLAVIHTLDTVEPSEAKMNLLAKAMSCNNMQQCKPAPRPNLCTTKCPTTPRTCPTTTTKCTTTCRTTTPCPPPTQPTEICMPEPTRCPQNSPERPVEIQETQPLIESTAAEQLLQIIRGMKRHALLMLKDLNYLELEILEKSLDSCPNHESQNEGQKNRERLDLPESESKLKLQFHQNPQATHQSQSFYFGVRPLDAMADLDEARDEELKLEQKVREEHQILRKQLKAKQNQWLQKAKRARSDEAPAAAARLETVYPKVIEKGVDEGHSKSSATLSLKSLNVVDKPLVPPAYPSGELGSSAKTDLPKPISPPQSQIYSINDHKLMVNEMTPQQIQPKTRKRKKKKKKKQKMLANVILRPERVPVEDRERIRCEQQQPLRNRRNRGRRRQSINNINL